MTAYTRDPQTVPNDEPGGSTVRQAVADQNSQAINDLFTALNSHSNSESGRSHAAIDTLLDFFSQMAGPFTEILGTCSFDENGNPNGALFEVSLDRVNRTATLKLASGHAFIFGRISTGTEPTWNAMGSTGYKYASIYGDPFPFTLRRSFGLSYGKLFAQVADGGFSSRQTVCVYTNIHDGDTPQVVLSTHNTETSNADITIQYMAFGLWYDPDEYVI